MNGKTKGCALILGLSISTIVVGTAAKGLDSTCSTSNTVTDVSNGTGGDPGTFGATGTVAAPKEQVQTFPTDSASNPSDDVLNILGLIGNVLQWKDKQSVATGPPSGVDWPDQPKPAAPGGDCIWLPVENLIEEANDAADQKAREAIDDYVGGTITHWYQLQNILADIERKFDVEVAMLELDYPSGWYKFCPGDKPITLADKLFTLERVDPNQDHSGAGPATKTDNNTALCGDTTPPAKDEDLDFRYVPHPPAHPPAKPPAPPPKPPDPPPKPPKPPQPRQFGDAIGGILEAILGIPSDSIPINPDSPGFDPVPPSDDVLPDDEKRVEIG